MLTSALALLLLAGSASAELDFESHAHATNQSLLWGTYRPNLYFGLRPRLPNSLLTGLMWFGTHDYQSYTRELVLSAELNFQRLTDETSYVGTRHACDQGDGLESYTFTEHDGRTAAVQVIKDAANNVKLTTELLKIPGGDAGVLNLNAFGSSLITGELMSVLMQVEAGELELVGNQ